MKEIIIDSNVILRFLVKASPAQTLQAQKLIKKINQGKLKGLISLLVINETLWILKTYYHLSKEIYLSVLLELISFEYIQIMEVEKEIIIAILETLKVKNIDFTDIYLFAIAKDRKIFSFDKDFKKLRKKIN